MKYSARRIEDGKWLIESEGNGLVVQEIVLKNSNEHEAKSIRDCLTKAYRAGHQAERRDRSVKIQRAIAVYCHCGVPAIPGLVPNVLLCQYHYDVRQFGKNWADKAKDWADKVRG